MSKFIFILFLLGILNNTLNFMMLHNTVETTLAATRAVGVQCNANYTDAHISRLKTYEEVYDGS